MILIISTVMAKAHTIGLFCWQNGHYNVHATLGASNGKIEVTTYTNSSMTTTVTGGNTQTYLLNSSGAVNFTVPQPNMNTPVYVRIKWFKRQGTGYVADNWNSGSPYSGTYTSTCHVTAILFGAIDARNSGNTTIITFQVESTDETNSIIVNYNMPNGNVKHFPIVFLDKLMLGDIWVITINNSTGSYTIKKK